MSRFQEAMERGKAAGSRGPAGRSAELWPEETPRTELFDAPWRIRDQDDEPAGRPPAAFGSSAAVRQARPAARAPETLAVGGLGTLQVRPDLSEKVVSDPATSAVVVEMYRSIAARLQVRRADHGCTTLMVGSAVAGEGRTLTALNLAISLRSSLLQSVLLVDADLVEPCLHHLLLTDERPGLGDALLTGQTPRPIALGKHLGFLPAGRSVAAPDVEALAAAIAQVSGGYDWTVLDTAPMTASVETRQLARLVDAVVMVAAAGRTSHQLAGEAIRQVADDRLVGLVLNGVASGDMKAAEHRRYRSQR
ncbi:MAG: cellulose synthase operon protein YhjQ/BcsQ [Vicinamibacterales bacterium]